MSQELTVVNNPVPQEIVVAKKVNALSRLFTLKPATLELVSKSTRQENATPGTFRVTQTNESFKEMRVVMIFEPVEQREMYRKGEYTKDAKECFSLDNTSPHPRAKNPPALYCASCPMGELMWDGWRRAKDKGVTGDQLTALLPKCRRYWHLFVADRTTKMPYYLNVKGVSVKPFETAMQNVARLFQMIITNLKVEKKPIPESLGDIIWKISFTLYPELRSGTWQMGFKDFKVMTSEDAAEFGQILEDINTRRTAGQLQSQEASEQEEEAAALTGQPAGNRVRQAEVVSVQTNEVAKQNSQIQI
jgi:hypothetical protein